MRKLIAVAAVAAFTAGVLGMPISSAEAAKTKLGCEPGKTKWNAVAGKCDPVPKKAKGKAKKKMK